MSVESAITNLTKGIKAQRENLNDYRTNIGKAGTENYQAINKLSLEIARTEGIVSAYEQARYFLEAGANNPDQVIQAITLMVLNRRLTDQDAGKIAYIDGEMMGTRVAISYILAEDV